LYFILFFCFAGAARNLRELILVSDYGYSVTNISVAMFVIYAAQITLILARESKAWIISAIQAFFCFYVYPDFTFLPAAALLQNIIFHCAPDMSYGWMSFISSSLISALFSLEVLKTYFIFALTRERTARKKKSVVGKAAANLT
jgi:hypothetical protein